MLDCSLFHASNVVLNTCAKSGNTWASELGTVNKMSRPARKPTVWTLHKASTRISLNMLRRLTRTDAFRLLWVFRFLESLFYTSIPLKRNGSTRISLRGLHRLIWFDTLRRCHTVGFLAVLLKCNWTRRWTQMNKVCSDTYWNVSSLLPISLKPDLNSHTRI